MESLSSAFRKRRYTRWGVRAMRRPAANSGFKTSKAANASGMQDGKRSATTRASRRSTGPPASGSLGNLATRKANLLQAGPGAFTVKADLVEATGHLLNLGALSRATGGGPGCRGRVGTEDSCIGKTDSLAIRLSMGLSR